MQRFQRGGESTSPSKIRNLELNRKNQEEEMNYNVVWVREKEGLEGQERYFYRFRGR